MHRSSTNSIIGKRNAEFNLYDPRESEPRAVQRRVTWRVIARRRSRAIAALPTGSRANWQRASAPMAQAPNAASSCTARWPIRAGSTPAVDPNDREPGTCYLGDPRIVNMGPVGLARFCTLRSWLSQWSFDESRANGVEERAERDVSGAGHRQHRRQRVHAEPHASTVRCGRAQRQRAARDQRCDALLRGATKTLRRGDRRVYANGWCARVSRVR